jgi:hypothetical protein
MPAAERLRRWLGPAVAGLVAAQLLALGAWSTVTEPDLAAGSGIQPRSPLTAPPTTAGEGDRAATTTSTAAPRGTATTARSAADGTATSPGAGASRPTTTVLAGPALPPAPTAPAPAPTAPPSTAPPATTPPAGVMPLGSVDATAPAGAGCPAGATCWQAAVHCPGVRDAEAVVAVRPAESAPAGVLVLFSGGRGEGWWEDGHVPGSGAGAPALRELAGHGVETVQVRWVGGFSGTDEGSSPGFARLACRSATAVAWLRSWRYEPLAAVPSSGPCGFCVTGNSGGASQAAWGLTHFGLDDLVDGVVLTSGPPHAAIDKGCLHRPGESAYWYDPGTAADFDMTYGATRSTAGPCSAHDGSAAAAFRRDGVATGGADYSWPGTSVTFLLGGDDPTVAPAHARDLVDRLGDSGTGAAVRVVPGMGHEVVGSPEGRSAFVTVVLGAA